jgi:ribosomal subunit interface protein
MRIEVTGQGMTVRPGLKEHVERRLAFALGRFEDRIDSVTVRLEDLNGPKGGVDKQCKIVVQIRKLPTVIVEQTAEDMYAAVDQAADRVGRAVTKKLEKARSRSTGSMRSV